MDIVSGWRWSINFCTTHIISCYPLHQNAHKQIQMKQLDQPMMMQLPPDCQSPPLVSNIFKAESLMSSSAVNLGYLSDPFVSHLYRPKYGESSQSGSRKPPLINVGTHHRTWAIDLLVNQFLQRGGKQVVSLGAGSDTRFWRLMVCLYSLIRLCL